MHGSKTITIEDPGRIRWQLRIVGYECESIAAGYEANCLLARITVEVVAGNGRYDAAQDVTLLTRQLIDFGAAAEELDRNLSGSISLLDHDATLRLCITLDRGRGEMSGFVNDAYGVELKFDAIAIDQTMVRLMLRDLHAVLRAFPAR